MAQLENGAQSTRISSSPQQQTSTSSSRPPLDLHVLDFQQGSANEGKEATVHDFLCLGGSKNTSSSVAKGLASSVTTQDLLQPLEKNIKPSTTSLLSHGLAISAGRPHAPAAEYVASQQNSYNLANGTLDLPTNVRYKSEGLAEGMKEKLENLAQWSNIQSKYGPSEIGYTSKALLTQGLPPISKQWQYQQQAGLDLPDPTKRTSRIPSEDDEDDEDEMLDHAYNTKRESFYQKSDITQKFEGKNNDLKGATPRSKHSATEQRRRSKINDRFQTLRQLLPNVDQKRDKASFLLEVIEYIQMLQEKVKKFETAEQGRQQEIAKSSSWDTSVMQRNSLCRDSTANTSYLPLVTAVTFDSKEVPESNGFTKNQSSPLRVTCEHEGAGSDFTSGMGQVLALQNRMSQGPQACASSYESKAALSKPMPIAQPAFDRISAPVFSSVSQGTSEAHAIFGHLVKQEEQAAAEAKGSFDHKVEVGSFPLPEASNQSRMGPDESAELFRPSQALDMQKTESSLRESEKDESRQILSADGSVVGPKSELPVNQHEPPIIQGGVINISSMYSQGLLDTITRALQSSGVDLTQATISVQIDLGKPGGDVGNSRQMARLGTGFSQFSNQETGSSPDSEQRRKKPKLEADA